MFDRTGVQQVGLKTQVPIGRTVQKIHGEPNVIVTSPIKYMVLNQMIWPYN
jgi:hypothetical protein